MMNKKLKGPSGRISWQTARHASSQREAGLDANRHTAGVRTPSRLARVTAILVAALLVMTPAFAQEVDTTPLQVYGLGDILTMIFSADGTKVLLRAAGNAQLFNASTGEHLRTFSGVEHVAFSPDGNLILATRLDSTAYLFDSRTGGLRRRFVGHTGGVNCVAFSPDGARVATGSDDTTALLWDIVTGEALQTFIGHTESVTSVVFSPDGTKILTAGGWDRTARLWDVNTGASLLTFSSDENTGYLSLARFSPDGTKVLRSMNGNITLWDSGTGAVLQTFREVSAAAFSPDGSTLLTAGLEDYLVRLWDADTGVSLRTIDGLYGLVHSVAFSPDGTQFLTGPSTPASAFSTGVFSSNNDGIARLWDIDSGVIQRTFRGIPDWTIPVFSPDGSKVLTENSNRTANLWDARTGSAVLEFGRGGHARALSSVVFSPDGSKVLTGSQDGTAKLWDASTGAVLQTFSTSDDNDEVPSAVFSPDGTQVLTAGRWKKTARLWDAGTGEMLRTFSGHTGKVNSVAFSPNRAQIVTGSSDTTARLWDADTGEVLLTLNGHTSGVLSVAFSPDGTEILTGGEDKTARLWDTDSGTLLRTFTRHGYSFASVAFSPDGTKVLMTGWEGTALLWDSGTGTLLQIFDVYSMMKVIAVAYSPDGSKVLTGSWDHTAKLWDADTGALLRTFSGHQDWVCSVAFSPDGKQVLTASKDGTARLWATETFAPVIASLDDGFIQAPNAYTGPTPSLTQGTLPVTWSLVAGPSGMTIDAGTGVVSWPASNSAESPYEITIASTNSKASGTQTWHLTVTPAGEDPNPLTGVEADPLAEDWGNRIALSLCGAGLGPALTVSLLGLTLMSMRYRYRRDGY